VKRPGDRRIVSAFTQAGPGVTPPAPGPAARRFRPLGASLPLPERAAALERRVRAFQALARELADAELALDVADTRAAEEEAEAAFWTAISSLYGLASANVNRRLRA